VKSTAKLKIGLSPFASSQDMQWTYENDYFWCTGANNESELWDRIIQVLAQSYQENVCILIFPELVVTENLQNQICAWLQQNNIYEPVIRLIVVGTRHVFIDYEKKDYVNRCIVLDSAGEKVRSLETGETWEQDKREMFRLNPYKAKELFNIESELLEPSCFSEKAIICSTALGRIATPICLDFIKADGLWQKLPIDIFLVPAMSDGKEGLSRFVNNSLNAGSKWGSVVFVCNAMPHDDNHAVYVYLPNTDNSPSTHKLSPHLLFITELDIDMN
jgi:predicted amidohydrolase